MVAPIVAAKAPKDVLDKDKKPSHAFDNTVKIINLIFMLLIVIALFLILLSFLWGFSFSDNSGGIGYSSNAYSEKIIKDYTSKNKNTLNPFFPSGIPEDGCYLAYICPGVPNNECENDTNDCMDYAETCTTNESCCSGCCKNMGSITSPYYECRLEGECQEGCYDLDRTCSNNFDCCSGCCNKPASSNYGMCSSLDVCQQCKEETETCTNSSQCCDGLACQNGKCAEICGEYLAGCETNSDCCSDCCRDYGECGFSQECCSHQNETCSSNSECCYGLTCQNRKCQPACTEEDEACSNNSDCCSGCCKYIPGGGFICQPEASCTDQCASYQEDCKLGDECCSGICTNFLCGCLQFGYSCPGIGSCCPGYECINGMCGISN